MSFTDKTIACAECGAEFTHSADAQQRYADRGFTNEPKRCRECRDKRKLQGSSQDRGERESFSATCGECGAPTTVPFKPTQGRPVFCRDCFRSRRR